MAGEERIELPSAVLETVILPLNYSPLKKGIVVNALFMMLRLR